MRMACWQTRTSSYRGRERQSDHLNKASIPYFVLTNDASALPETRAARYENLGLSIDAGRIITSGSLLKGFFKEHGLEGHALRNTGHGG